MDTYDDLLMRGYSQIPEKTSSGERFEIPIVDSIIEGNKTIIKNFEFIAGKLRREKAMLAKFFTKELAVPSSIEGTRFVLQARFSDRVLNDRLRLFVEMYVLCKECRKPDTNITDGAHSGRMLICEACGARAPVKG